MIDAPAPVIEARDLAKHFRIGGRFSPGGVQVVHALDGVSLSVRRGETLALVGKSGCGKSTLGRCLLRLYRLSGGTLRFDGTDITTMSERRLRRLRPRMQMVFQDPYASLNPRRRVGELIAQPLRVHRRWGRARITERLAELMALVGLPREHLARFPHEFSGGQRQRIGIARALALDPGLVIADEPVSALDVSVQAQIVNLLMDLQERLGLTYVFIAHDLSVVRQIARRTAVMYLGTIVETGPTEAVFTRPAHPVHRRIDLGGAGGRDRAAARSDRAGRRGAEPAGAATGLPLPHTLPARRGAMPHRGAAAARLRWRPGGRLPFSAGGERREWVSRRPVRADAERCERRSADCRWHARVQRPEAVSLPRSAPGVVLERHDDEGERGRGSPLQVRRIVHDDRMKDHRSDKRGNAQIAANKPVQSHNLRCFGNWRDDNRAPRRRRTRAVAALSAAPGRRNIFIARIQLSARIAPRAVASQRVSSARFGLWYGRC